MRFWVRWDFFIGAVAYPLIGSMFLPRVGESLIATGAWIVWGWIVFGSFMLIGTMLSRRHPDLGKRIEREDLLPCLFPRHEEELQNPPPDK